MTIDEVENDQVPAPPVLPAALPGLTPQQFSRLAEVPPEMEWLANITSPKTRRAYRIDAGEFSAFAGLRSPAELRAIRAMQSRARA